MALWQLLWLHASQTIEADAKPGINKQPVSFTPLAAPPVIALKSTSPQGNFAHNPIPQNRSPHVQNLCVIIQSTDRLKRRKRPPDPKQGRNNTETGPKATASTPFPLPGNKQYLEPTQWGPKRPRWHVPPSLLAPLNRLSSP